MRRHEGQRSAVRPVDGKNWRPQAACRCADPDLFFPVSDCGESMAQVAEAKAMCAGCEVRAECLAFAMHTRQVHGIWGGLTEHERYPVGFGRVIGHY
jgi:WhiB family redox-sensing transcriptional regulator